MNTKNNQRSQNTEMRIESTLALLLQSKHLSKITVRELCEGAQISRTSFYGHYEDVYDLLDHMKKKMSLQIEPFFRNQKTGAVNPTRESFISLLNFIRDNKLFYRYFFKNADIENAILLTSFESYSDESFFNSLDSSESDLVYRRALFVGGLNAIIKLWLEQDCPEPSEEIVSIFSDEFLNTVSSIGTRDSV